jgi:hypothetical protein
LKPVVAVPPWLALPLYAMYAAAWVAAMVLIGAIATVIVIGYGIVALFRRRAGLTEVRLEKAARK